MTICRRDFLKLVGLGSAVIVLGEGSIRGAASGASTGDFIFLQMSDTHWGYSDPKINPDYAGTLRKAVAAANSLASQPDFIIFTGDLTHSTEDPQERRKRMAAVRDIISELKVKTVRFMPGEHDASFDKAEAFQENFGKTHYVFDHKGVNFIVLDNVSDPTSSLGDTQLQWFRSELQKLDKGSRIVIFTHRPLFDLYPQWDWWTRDGAKAIELLMPYKDVTVFYGHIHQEHHHMTEHIAHHAAKGLMLPLPAPGSLPKRTPIPWDPAAPYNGLGYRGVTAGTEKTSYEIIEYPVKEK